MGNLASLTSVEQVAGDCNQDGNVDIWTSFCGVQLLFVGFDLLDRTPALPPCLTPAGNLAVLDVNGDDGLNVSDIVRFLAAFLFQGGVLRRLGSSASGSRRSSDALRKPGLRLAAQAGREARAPVFPEEAGARSLGWPLAWTPSLGAPFAWVAASDRVAARLGDQSDRVAVRDPRPPHVNSLQLGGVKPPAGEGGQLPRDGRVGDFQSATMPPWGGRLAAGFSRNGTYSAETKPAFSRW